MTNVQKNAYEKMCARLVAAINVMDGVGAPASEGKIWATISAARFSRAALFATVSPSERQDLERQEASDTLKRVLKTLQLHWNASPTPESQAIIHHFAQVIWDAFAEGLRKPHTPQETSPKKPPPPPVPGNKSVSPRTNTSPVVRPQPPQTGAKGAAPPPKQGQKGPGQLKQGAVQQKLNQQLAKGPVAPPHHQQSQKQQSSQKQKPVPVMVAGSKSPVVQPHHQRFASASVCSQRSDSSKSNPSSPPVKVTPVSPTIPSRVPPKQAYVQPPQRSSLPLNKTVYHDHSELTGSCLSTDQQDHVSEPNTPISMKSPQTSGQSSASSTPQLANSPHPIVEETVQSNSHKILLEQQEDYETEVSVKQEPAKPVTVAQQPAPQSVDLPAEDQCPAHLPSSSGLLSPLPDSLPPVGPPLTVEVPALQPIVDVQQNPDDYYMNDADMYGETVSRLPSQQDITALPPATTNQPIGAQVPLQPVVGAQVPLQPVGAQVPLPPANSIASASVPLPSQPLLPVSQAVPLPLNFQNTSISYDDDDLYGGSSTISPSMLLPLPKSAPDTPLPSAIVPLTTQQFQQSETATPAVQQQQPDYYDDLDMYGS